MKLLTKSEIEQHRAKERKLEIDEGLKLARRVDNLRKTVADEQKALGDFARANSKELIEQIADRANELHAISLEIQALREEREKLEEPLDAAWEEVEKARTDLQERALELRTEELRLEADKEANHREELELQRIVRKTRLDAEETRRLAAEAAARKKEVDAHAVAEERRIARLVANAEHEASELRQREDTVALREKRAAQRSKDLDKRELELANEKRRVQDLYQTYLRNRERHGERSKGRE